MRKTNAEYEAFEGTMRDLLKVPHSEIKAKLDAEKARKRRKKAKQSSASGRARDDRA